MSFMQVAAGGNIPYEINVVIEIPAFSDPVKYEVDKHTGALTVDRFMGTAMQYPAITVISRRPCPRTATRWT